MKRLALVLVLLLFPLSALAGEPVKGTNFFVADNQGWETGEGTGYWMWHGTGVSNHSAGPFKTGSVECHGAGFWDAEGTWGEGICLHADEDGTRTSVWGRGKGEELGRWEIVSGTGKYAGITGQGSYKSTPLPDDRHMSEFEGEVTLAQ